MDDGVGDAYDELRSVLRQPDRRSLRRHLRQVSRAAAAERRAGSAAGSGAVGAGMVLGLGLGLGPEPASGSVGPAASDLAGSDGRRSFAAAAVVVVGLAIAILGIGALWPRRGAGVAREPGVIDVAAPEADGDAMAETSGTTTTTMAVRLWPAEPVEVEGTHVRSGGRTWAVGEEGDVVAIGDWDCDRVPTPAVLRPSTGVVAVFDRWATDDGEVEARTVATLAGATSLRAGGSCGQALVGVGDAGDERTVRTTEGGAP